MMFLQFFVWGAWYVTMGTYLLQGLKFTGTQTAQAYSTMPWGAIVAPFFVGMIADRFFAAEKVLAVLHLAGAALLYCVSTLTDPGAFFWVLLVYALCYMPTLALANAISFHQMASPGEAVSRHPRVRHDRLDRRRASSSSTLKARSHGGAAADRRASPRWRSGCSPSRCRTRRPSRSAAR